MFAEAVAQRVGTALVVSPDTMQDVSVTKMEQDGPRGEGWVEDSVTQRVHSPLVLGI